MMVVIAYDVDTSDPAGERRLRQVAKQCVSYGQRVQNSVFEFVGDEATMAVVKKRLLSLIDVEKDNLRFYNLGNRYAGKVEHYGAKPGYEAEGFLAF